MEITRHDRASILMTNAIGLATAIIANQSIALRPFAACPSFDWAYASGGIELKVPSNYAEGSREQNKPLLNCRRQSVTF